VNNYLNNNDYNHALEVFSKQVPLINAIMGGGQGASYVKTALKIKGILKNKLMRLPVTPTTDSQEKQIAKAL
jgi:4-hydroxy-tetrahydrodipicolinate synthase